MLLFTHTHTIQYFDRRGCATLLSIQDHFGLILKFSRFPFLCPNVNSPVIIANKIYFQIVVFAKSYFHLLVLAYNVPLIYKVIPLLSIYMHLTHCQGLSVLSPPSHLMSWLSPALSAICISHRDI